MISAARSPARQPPVQGTASPHLTDPDDTRSAGSDGGPRHNLPIQLSTFVGRKRELAQINDVLGSSRLLTLTGSGGVGKTRLALQVAAECQGEYADGIWFVDLAPLRDPMLLPHTVANALGQPEEPVGPVLEALITYLGDRTVLLVLDNCEHVLAASAGLTTRLLQGCPRVTILATSREALHIPGERIWLVPPLGLPDDADTQDGERVGGHEAIWLFAERAAAASREFGLTSSNLPGVVEVCRRLDGVPLAIELAAARTGVLTPAEIAAHLDDRLDLFSMGSGAARQRTLRALCDWSHQLLSEPERRLFRRLAVFAGGWTLEAAEAVCAVGDLAGTAPVLGLVSALVDKSVAQAHHQGDRTRYSFHETLRQFALDKLREASEETEFRDRHLAWYAGLAERIGDELRGPGVSRGLDRLALEHGNLRAALGWGRDNPVRIETALMLASALAWYWWAREHSHEGCRWLEELLELSNSTVDSDQSRSLGTVRAKGFSALGLLYVRRGDLRAARPLVERSLALARSIRAAPLYGWPLLLLGQIELGEAQFDRARALLEEGLAVSSQGVSPRPYQFLSWLGHVAAATSMLDDAEALYRRQLLLARKQGDAFFEAVALANLARMAVRRGDAKLARRRLGESLVLMAEVATGDVPGVLSGFVEIAILEGSFMRALRLAGAVEGLLTARGATMQSLWSSQLIPQLEAARLSLPAEVAAAALAEGRLMTLGAAVAYALKGDSAA